MNYKAGANHTGHVKRSGAPAPRHDARSQEVWTHNLEEEMLKMQDVAEEYSHVAMDALLPGIVAQPTGPFGDYAGYNYQTLRCNVDLTRAIQIGLTLSDAEGNQPKTICTWRFNFAFDAGSDLVSPELMERLRHQFDLEKHQREGIDAPLFAELLMSSGLVLNEDIRWISYCASGSFGQRSLDTSSNGCADLLGLPFVSFCGLYNFGHLLHLLTSQSLPDGVEGFYEALDLFFPSRCDVAKHIHQLPQLSGRDPSDPQRRPLFCNANHLIEAFFRLPDAVRWKAFDKHQDLCDDGKPQRDSEGRRTRPESSASNGMQ
jgi:hypothetical protein